MSTTNCTTKQPYCHLSEVERGKIESFLSEGLKPAEIARRLGRSRSTISREIKRGTTKQVKQVNGKKVYFDHYFADLAQRRYVEGRQGIDYLKLEKVSEHFLKAFEEAMKASPRVHSVESFVYAYKEEHPSETIPSTKTLYNYSHQGLLAIKAIDFPKAVRLRKKTKKRSSTQKHLGVSIEERPETINDRSVFGHWEIDSVLGTQKAGEPSILTLVERKTHYAITAYLAGKKAEDVNEAVAELIQQYPIKSITADNGSEFASLNELEGVQVYYAHAYSSYERGTNENFNGLLREFVPKGKSLKTLTAEDLAKATLAINQRPRGLLNYQTAKTLFGLTQTA